MKLIEKKYITKSQTLPYNIQANKNIQIELMFNNIAPRYDMLNRLLSLGIDRLWRHKAINAISNRTSAHILDIATGTADFAIEAMRLKPEKIIGIDISEQMLEIGRKKIGKLNFSDKISLMRENSEQMSFPDSTFDVAICSFGVRNFQSLTNGLREIRRVLKHKGIIIILEFSKPEKMPIKQIYNIYFSKILPFFGGIISKDKAAYTYLPRSVESFPCGKQFITKIEECGFENATQTKLTFGIASIYKAFKK